MKFVCHDVDRLFSELKQRLQVIDLYLSFRPKNPNECKRLADHLRHTVEYINKLQDHIPIVAKVLYRLELEISGRKLDIESYAKASQVILRFVALYHDIGKAEIQYQLYAHHLCDRAPPHNYSSVVFLLHNSEIYEKFLDKLMNLGFSPRTADTIFTACITAIAMHHEYFDYKDIAFLEMLTPLTLSLGKGIDIDTALYFDSTVFDLLKHVGADYTDIPIPSNPRPIVSNIGEVFEYISSIHYEFGALWIDIDGLRIEKTNRRIELTSSLAEVLTWILAIADNLAAKHRKRLEEDRTFFAKLIQEYYG